MPRVKMAQPAHGRLRVLLQGTVMATGRSTEDVARIWGCSQPTAIKRLHNPGCITVDQLLQISSGLGIPLDEIRQAISKA